MKTQELKPSKIKVDPNMRDYSKDPYFVKKDEEARKFIARVGLPKELIKLQAKRMVK